MRWRKRRRRGSVPAAAFLAAFLLVGCGSGTEENASPGAQPGTSGSCQELTEGLRQEYARLRACARDEECNFIEGFYRVIPRDDRDGVVRVFDCKEVSPLLGVANGAAVEAGRSSLLALREAQARACARPPDAFVCQAFSDIPRSPPPRCRDGRCEAEPF
ncbi:MAG: hypothetical protein NDJ89_17765 [Oligoflexia bacterium]|nr:hypothetical protein [Oligoflexia bacterium]